MNLVNNVFSPVDACHVESRDSSYNNPGTKNFVTGATTAWPFEGAPEPGRPLRPWFGVGGFYSYLYTPPGGITQIVYSPNPDGGETGPDTCKGMGMQFLPIGDRDAVDVRLSVYFDQMNALNSEQDLPNLGIGIWGILEPSPVSWPSSNMIITLDPPEGQDYSCPWVSPKTDVVKWTIPASVGNVGQITSPNLAAIYNQLRNQPGFVPGTSRIVLAFMGLPWYGGAFVDVLNTGGASVPTGTIPNSITLTVTTDTDKPASFYPSAPASVAAVSASGTITVSCTAVTGATGYNLYRVPAGCDLTAPAIKACGVKVSSGSNSIAVSGLSAGSQYFVMTVVDASGLESAASAVVTADSAIASGGTPPAAAARNARSGGSTRIIRAGGSTRNIRK